MNLNKNEIGVFKLLIENSNQTNVEIAKKIGITPQAVGKIKKKLESERVIRGYSIDVDLDYVGIKTFAVALFSYSPELNGKEREDDLRDCVKKPNILCFYRIPEGDISHIVVYGFKDLNELENYFQGLQDKIGTKSSLKRLYIFSDKGLIKNSGKELMLSVL